MIRLTRINHVPLVVNSDLIEHVEVTPDTVISLTTGQKFVVLETPDDVIDRVVAFRRAIHDPVARLVASGGKRRGRRTAFESSEPEQERSE